MREMATRKTTLWSLNLTESYAPSSRYTITSTSSFVVALMSHTNDITGLSATLL